MKTFLLAAVMAAGLLVCSANTAEAQLLRRNRVYYTEPTYTSGTPPVYSSGTYTTTYTTPTYSGGVVARPTTYSSGFIPGTLLHPGYYPSTNYYTSPNTFYPGTYYPGSFPSGVPSVGLRW